jgi:hypothetical protein
MRPARPQRRSGVARFYAEIHAIDFGVWTNGIGEARDGSHEAERMSSPI